MPDNTEENLQEVRRVVQKAVEKNEDVQAAVRDITLKALSEGELDRQRIKSVAEAVMQGSGDAVVKESKQMKKSLGEAAAGLEQALIKAADAFRLAIEEAVGRVNEFNSSELKRSVNDLDSLEDIFVETLQRTATSGGEVVRTIAEELATHARHSGTSVGQHVAQSVESLQNQLQELGADTAEAGQEAANRIGQIARGILAGVGETLLTMAEEKKGSGSNKP